MILLILSIIYNSSFEMGIIPNGASNIYNNEYWSEKVYIFLGNGLGPQIDSNQLIYYSDFCFQCNIQKFFIGGNIKTYAQKGIKYFFSPYRTRYEIELGWNPNKTIQIGYKHSCTHSSISDFPSIFTGSYDEFYIRFEIKNK